MNNNRFAHFVFQRFPCELHVGDDIARPMAAQHTPVLKATRNEATTP